MAEWFFEPGHTAAGFCVRHMMVTNVAGISKTCTANSSMIPTSSRFPSEVLIDAKSLWTGEQDRDAHLRSADFLDVEHHPTITFAGNK